MKRLLMLLVFASAVFAQSTQCNITNAGNPFTSATAGTTYDNRLTRCNTWVFTYYNAGFSAVSIQLEGAPTNAANTAAGAFAAISTGISVGVNPATSTTGGTLIVQSATFYPWVRINPTTATGTGTITYSLNGSSGIVAKVSPTALPPNGAAGGDLSGTYPNPNVAKVNGTTVPVNSAADQIPLTTASAVAAWTAINNCTGATAALSYATASHTFGCNTISSGAPSKQFTSTQIVTVSGTAAATTLLGTGAGTLTLPANFWANAGDVLHIHAELTMDANGTAGSADAFNIKLGATTLATGTAGTAPTATAGTEACTLDTIFTAVTVGSSGTIMGNGTVICRVVGASDAARITIISNGGGPAATTTVNTTTTQVLDFQVAQGSTAHITKQVGFLVTNY